MNRVQYYHNNLSKRDIINYNDAFTAVCEVPTILKLYTLVTDHLNGIHNTIGIPVGVTWVNPKDNYCKETGRTESLKKCKTIPFTLSSIHFRNGNTEITLECPDEKYGVDSIVLELGPDRNRAYFVSIIAIK